VAIVVDALFNFEADKGFKNMSSAT